MDREGDALKIVDKSTCQRGIIIEIMSKLK
jgi:hypothetical protein